MPSFVPEPFKDVDLEGDDLDAEIADIVDRGYLDYYLHGRCHLMAVELHRATGLPPAGMSPIHKLGKTGFLMPLRGGHSPSQP